MVGREKVKKSRLRTRRNMVKAKQRAILIRSYRVSTLRAHTPVEEITRMLDLEREVSSTERHRETTTTTTAAKQTDCNIGTHGLVYRESAHQSTFM